MTTTLNLKPQFLDLALTYNAKEDRQMFADLIGMDGIVAINDWLVVPKGGTAGNPDAGGAKDRSVDILAPSGAAAWVLGDDTPATQGIYRQLADGTAINEALAINTSGQVRTDLAILEIVPGSNLGRTRIVQGTPGAGQPATPNNALTLAAITCADSYTQIANAQLTDLRTKFRRHVYTAGLSADASVTNPWTQLIAITFTLARDRQVDIAAWCKLVNSASGRPVVALQVLDTAAHLFGTGQEHMGGTSDLFGEEILLTIPRRTVSLTAGTHTINLQAYKNTTGTVVAKKTETLGAQAITVTGLEITL